MVTEGLRANRGRPGLGRGRESGSTYPAAPLRNPPGNAVMQHEVGHEAGHLAQEAGQATLVDVQGQAVAEAQESHHSAPVDAALKQAAGRVVILSAESPRRPCSLLFLSHCLVATRPAPSWKAERLSCEPRWQRLPQPGLSLGRACISVKGENSEGV